MDALVSATGGRLVTKEVTGPLGERVKASYGLLGDGETAVIEMAAASGLPLVPLEKRNPMLTTTYGTLIPAALDEGCRRIIIGIGGSATNDGGAGITILGVKLLDEEGLDIPYGAAGLARLDRIDISSLDRRLAQVEVLVACDVDNPLTGPRGAARVYGPQKGADPQMVEELDQILERFAAIILRDLGKDVKDIPGAGAAGGLGAGLMAFLNGRLAPGVELVLAAVKLEERIQKGADLVITGEGAINEQTVYGKIPIGVAKLAKGTICRHCHCREHRAGSRGGLWGRHRCRGGHSSRAHDPGGGHGRGRETGSRLRRRGNAAAIGGRENILQIVIHPEKVGTFPGLMSGLHYCTDRLATGSVTFPSQPRDGFGIFPLPVGEWTSIWEWDIMMGK